MAHGRSGSQFIHFVLSIPIRRPWVTAVVVLSAASVVFFKPTSPALTVDPDLLVREALHAERTHPMTRVRALRVTYTPYGPGPAVTFVQDGVSRGDPALAASRLPAAVLRLVRTYGVDWAQPMSAEPFATWRNTVAYRKERVERDVRDGSLTLRTSAADGELREGELTVDGETWQLLRQRLVFSSVGRLELEALPLDGANTTSNSSAWSAPIAARISRDDLDLAALRALLVLGQTGLDMRAQIRVSRTSEAVRVDGVVAPAAAGHAAAASAENVRRALAGVPHLQIAFSEPGLSSSSTAQGAIGRPGSRRALDHWVSRKFGDTEVRASFLPDLTRALDTIHLRLERLSGLAHDYPADARRTMTAEGRGLFQQVVHVHAVKLRTEMATLREHLSVVAGTVTVAQPGPDPTALLMHAPVALTRAAALSHQVQALLAREEVSPAEQDQVRMTFEALWAELYGPTLAHSQW